MEQQVALPMEQVDLQGLQERGEQLHQIETNIVQVRELFLDVKTVINEHGENIDRIEAHTFEIEENVEDANEKLVKALKDRNAARRKQLILCAILIFIIAIIALILGIYFGTQK